MTRPSFRRLLIASALLATLATLISLRFVINLWGDASPEALLFFVLLSFGNQWIVFTVFNCLGVFLLSRLRAQWPALLLYGVVNTTYLVALTLDSYVYDLFHFHINITMLELAIKGGRQFLVISDTMVYKTIAGVVVLLVACLLAWLFSNKLLKKRWPMLLVLAGFLSFLSSNLWHAYENARQNYAVATIAEALPLCKPLRARKLFPALGLIDPSKAVDTNPQLTGTFNQLQYPLKPLTCAPKDKYNVLVLMIDALRYDQLNPKVMPNVYREAQRGEVFPHYLSGGDSTQGGVFSFFTGLPAIYWKPFLAQGQSTVLIDELLKHGYEAQVFASAQLQQPEFSKTIFSTIPNLRTTSQGDTPSQRDRNAIDDFLKWVPSDKPFFSFIFLDAVHGYDAPKAIFKPMANSMDFSKLSNDTDPTPYKNLYSSAAYYDDSLLKEVFDALRTKDLLDKTIVIFTADHGEEFNDNKRNYWGHGSNFTEAQIHTPFVVWWPGHKPSVNDRLTSGLDVMPTLMEKLLGCSNPVTDYSVGIPWTQPDDRAWFYSSGYSINAYVTPERIYVINHAGAVVTYDKQAKRLFDEPLPLFFKEVFKDQSRYLK